MYANIIRCQELFDDMCYSHQLNPDLVDTVTFDERVELFRHWAGEFCDKEKYKANEPDWDWVQESEDFFCEKLREKFVAETEYTVTFAANIDIRVKARTKEELKKKIKEMKGAYRNECFEYVSLLDDLCIVDENGNEV